MKKTSVVLIDGPRKGDQYVLSELELPEVLKVPKNVDGISGGTIRMALYKRLPDIRGKAAKLAYTFSRWADEDL